MVNANTVKEFIYSFDYDLRKSNNGRWIDQKCTPDVVTMIADCVLEYVCNPDCDSEKFSAKDIWYSQYADENIKAIFSKPSTTHENSLNEYDKFFAQPLEMLAYSGVLKKIKERRKNFYQVQNVDILEYISINEKNSYNFITLYCQKVMEDSGAWKWFDNFFKVQTQDSFKSLKENYEKLIISNTNINNHTEVRRIFTKVLNPLACLRGKCGTVRGRLSLSPITYAEMMYNRENFRDFDKPKGISRQEWNLNRKKSINIEFYKYQSTKAKRKLRKYNDEYRKSKSEFADEFSNGLATQMHHIFPESKFPELSMYLENIIALTPTQHYNYAHPDGKTNEIDTNYQKLLLKAKCKQIQENKHNVYKFENFVEVLNIGLSIEHEFKKNDFNAVNEMIEKYL